MAGNSGRWVEDEVKGLASDFNILQNQQMPEDIHHENWDREVYSSNKRLPVVCSYLNLIQFPTNSQFSLKCFYFA